MQGFFCERSELTSKGVRTVFLQNTWNCQKVYLSCQSLLLQGASASATKRFSANSLGAVQNQKKRKAKKTYSFGFTSLFLYFCLLLFQLVPLPSPKSPIFEPVQLKSKFCRKLLKIIKRGKQK
jgi:hypothetical protein